MGRGLIRSDCGAFVFVAWSGSEIRAPVRSQNSRSWFWHTVCIGSHFVEIAFGIAVTHAVYFYCSWLSWLFFVLNWLIRGPAKKHPSSERGFGIHCCHASVLDGPLVEIGVSRSTRMSGATARRIWFDGSAGEGFAFPVRQ
jgi:hypothetical protein